MKLEPAAFLLISSCSEPDVMTKVHLFLMDTRLSAVL